MPKITRSTVFFCSPSTGQFLTVEMQIPKNNAFQAIRNIVSRDPELLATISVRPDCVPMIKSNDFDEPQIVEIVRDGIQHLYKVFAEGEELCMISPFFPEVSGKSTLVIKKPCNN